MQFILSQRGFSRILLLVIAALIIGLLGHLLSSQVAAFVFDISSSDIAGFLVDPSDSPNGLIQFLQAANTISLFIIPSVLFLSFIPKNENNFASFRVPKLFDLGTLVLLFIAAVPLINFLVAWNQSLSLPEMFSEIEAWMISAEEQAGALTDVFLKMSKPTDLFINLIIVALLPALGEELVFRRIIQKEIAFSLKSEVLAIWISAFLFSALHLQFFGFFARLLLGVYFGYLFYWSGNINLSIAAHFINNATAICLAYFLGMDKVEKSVDQIGVVEGSETLPLFSLVIFLLIMISFRKRHKKSPIKLG